jgi:hypothetical protein
MNHNSKMETYMNVFQVHIMRPNLFVAFQNWNPTSSKQILTSLFKQQNYDVDIEQDPREKRKKEVHFHKNNAYKESFKP